MARTPYQPIGLYALSYNDAVGLTKEFDDLRAALRKSEAEVMRLDALNRELAVDLKEWRIRFPVNDPTIARRMVEDRARAEAESALATERAARESAEREREPGHAPKGSNARKRSLLAWRQRRWRCGRSSIASRTRTPWSAART